jgi:O-acetylhomoserine/O-acetylserine sulfhydrylase-like pyridoxal-dependent enzyme
LPNIVMVAIGGVVVDGGNFDWGSGRFPGFTTPDPSYHGLVHWDAFKAFPPAGGANVAFALKLRLQLLRDVGACISPFNAWQSLIGIETLHLRMERICQNALAAAHFLKDHPKVAWVNYPGLPGSKYHAAANKYLTGGYGGLLGFGVKAGFEGAKNTINALRLFSHLANIPLGAPLIYAEVIPVFVSIYKKVSGLLFFEQLLFGISVVTNSACYNLQALRHRDELLQELTTVKSILGTLKHGRIFVGYF